VPWAKSAPYEWHNRGSFDRGLLVFRSHFLGVRAIPLCLGCPAHQHYATFTLRRKPLSNGGEIYSGVIKGENSLLRVELPEEGGFVSGTQRVVIKQSEFPPAP